MTEKYEIWKVIYGRSRCYLLAGGHLSQLMDVLLSLTDHGVTGHTN
jgi:hypothetical protein